jgi:hypothetical protein
MTNSGEDWKRVEAEFRRIAPSALQSFHAQEKLARLERSSNLQRIMLSQTDLAVETMQDNLVRLKSIKSDIIQQLNQILADS